MKPLLILLSLALLFAACGQPRHHARAHPTKTMVVHHLPDGRYAYQDDNGAFWFYMYLSQSSHTQTYYVSSASTALPRGGGWVSASSVNSTVTPADVESAQQSFNSPAAQVVEESVEVNTAGEPMSLSEATENAAYDGTEAHADGMTDDSPSSSSDSSSSDSGSSSSDSGGGDSGGSSDGGGGGGD